MIGMRRGTGDVFPTEFIPPAELEHPDDLFIRRPGPVNPYMERFTHREDNTKILIYTNGTCHPIVRPTAKAAWAFYFGPGPEARTISGRLKRKGPFGDLYEHTSHRAQLRAALAALRARQWSDDGYSTVVIASNSRYLVKGITEGVKNWVRNNWTTPGGSVVNSDLWQLLLGETERYQELGLSIQYWLIDRDMNKVAGTKAQQAVSEPDKLNFEDSRVWSV